MSYSLKCNDSVTVKPNMTPHFCCQLLEHNNYVSYGWMLRKAKTELLEFKWKTKGITQDCAVFAMRHMETHMGTEDNDWKCDLTNKPSKLFQLFHAKFVIAIVYSNENKVMDYMMRTTTSHLEEARKKGPVDVEKMTTNFPKP
ncbi:hypothetical protein SASPL_123531 [Salvia splendens]|uniref:Uncharacterized protein n=1 Tax=Salvia splendens TaxID=180675 RepID=A0A8X8XNQ9_SALSN|nr:hypothetical protein SASPL_123531 [Salvia splendens]